MQPRGGRLSRALVRLPLLALDMGTEVISPIFKWSYADTISDFSAGLSKDQIVEAIDESIRYMKRH